MAGEKSNTNLYWYIALLFIVVIFVSATQLYSSAMLLNPEINGTLSNDTIEYILSINGIDLSEYETKQSEIESNDFANLNNDTGSQPKDFALEFFYSRSQASKIGNIAKNIFSLPSYISILLKIPINSINWIISILNWFWRISIIIAGYYFIRGLK